MRELFQVDTINMSVAVWVGIIALIKLATDDGVIMATYLRDKFREQEETLSVEMVRLHGWKAPVEFELCLMTTATTFVGPSSGD